MATVAKFTWTGVNFLNQSIVNGGSRGTGTVLAPLFMGVGKGGATAALITDTNLNTELTTGADTTPGTYARAAVVNSSVTISQTNDTLQGVATWTDPPTATAGSTVSEVGWFDAATVGNMWFRATFTGIALSQGFGLQATMQAQMTTS